VAAKNLTLTIDDDVLRKARKIALDRDTSVNQLVRDYLFKLIQDEKVKNASSLADLEEIFRASRVSLGGRSWTRDELHER
jgi:hypothetical protein